MDFQGFNAKKWNISEIPDWRGHGKIEWKSKGVNLQKNRYPQHGGVQFLSGKANRFNVFDFNFWIYYYYYYYYY